SVRRSNFKIKVDRRRRWIRQGYGRQFLRWPSHVPYFKMINTVHGDAGRTSWIRGKVEVERTIGSGRECFASPRTHEQASTNCKQELHFVAPFSKMNEIKRGETNVRTEL